MKTVAAGTCTGWHRDSDGVGDTGERQRLCLVRGIQARRA